MPKVNILYWILTQGKIIAIDNLKNIVIVRPTHRILCTQDEELIQHIFIDCSYAKESRLYALEGLFPRVG
jgi:hypothetical protein